MTVNTAPDTTEKRHLIERVRHELKRRLLTVRRVAHVTPQMLRVTLEGADLDGFVSLGHDDHVKVLVPRPGEEPTFPEMGPDGKLLIDPKTARRCATTPRAAMIRSAASSISTSPCTRQAPPPNGRSTPRSATSSASAARAAPSSSPPISTGTCWSATKPHCPPSAAASRNCRKPPRQSSSSKSPAPRRSSASPARPTSRPSGCTAARRLPAPPTASNCCCATSRFQGDGYVWIACETAARQAPSRRHGR
jgi:NADPH-dependent ferric siderophore reductase